MNVHTLFRLAAIPAAAMLMTACGGGGGGGGSTPATPTMNGTATKGVIRNGVVTLSQPGGGGATGSARTDANGRYTLPYTGYVSGPVQICVTAATSAPLTTVVCDAATGPDCGPSNGAAGDGGDGNFDLGDEMPAPATFSMCTLLPAPPGSGVSAPITPFTNIVKRRAEQRAQALSEPLATALTAATNEVSQLIGGLDVLRLEPVNLADADAVDDASPDALVYAALIAAVLGNSVDALAPSTSLNLEDVIASILDATNGGEIALDDLRELLDEAQEQLLAQGQSDDTGVIATLNAQADAAEEDGSTTFNPEFDPDANNTGIAAARTLIQNVRNTYSSLDSYRAPLDAFGVDLDSAATVVEANEATAEALSATLVAAREFFDIDPACDDENCSITTDGITTTFTTSGGTLTGTIAGTSSAGATVDVQVTAPAGHADGASTATLNVVRATVSTSTARLQVTEGTVVVNLAAGQTFDADLAEDGDPTNNQSATIIDNASFDLVGSVEARSGATVLASATGTIRFDVVRATGCALAPTDPTDDLEASANVSDLDIVGTITSGTESAELSVEMNLLNARTFCPLTDIAPNNKPDADLTVIANLNLDAVPDARAVFTASLDDVFARTPTLDDDRAAGFLANASVNLLQNNVQVFRVQAASTRVGTDNDETITATVTDSSSAAMVLTTQLNAEEPVEGDIGVLTVGGTRVGVIRQLSSGLVIARYDDGTFESLF